MALCTPTIPSLNHVAAQTARSQEVHNHLTITMCVRVIQSSLQVHSVYASKIPLVLILAITNQL